MKNYKVCILAAGIGSRSFDPNINKSLLPLDGKAVISNIINKFDQKQKFVIALGYLSDQVKQYILHAHPKNEFEFVIVKKYFGLGSGPGHSLLCCQKKLKCPFIITSADTVVLENVSTPKQNWIGVAPIKNTSDFCTVQTNGNIVTRIDDKTLNDNRLAWIGLAGIKDYKYSDPNELKLLDSETITVEEGAKHICYVYGDHKELNSSAKRDHGNDAVIPAWHPHHLLPSDAQYVNGYTGSSGTKKYPENKLGNGTFRKIHPRAGCTSANENDRILAGTNGQANNSVRYGKFKETDASEAVFLDFFVEHHGDIDTSGQNEYASQVYFGQQVDYSGTRPELVYQTLAATGVPEHSNKSKLTTKTNSDKAIYRLHDIYRHQRHKVSDLSDSYYAKGEVAFNSSYRAEYGKVYKFSIVGVSNMLATGHDCSYNKNMVDWDRTFYPYRHEVANERTNNGNNRVDMPQPFQKYVYDPSGERIVTYGYAISNLHENLSLAETAIHNGFPFAQGDKSVDSSGTTGAIIRPGSGGEEDHYYGDLYKKVHADSSGTLYATRSHFTVVVTKSGCDIVTSDRLSETTGKMVFNSQEMLKGVEVATGQTEVSKVPSNLGAKDGEVRIMQKIDGSRIMAYYNSTSKK